MSSLRGNPNWSSGGQTPVPNGPSAFEQQVNKLRLKPEQYLASAELREWCLANMRSHYVPEELLEKWLSKLTPIPDEDMLESVWHTCAHFTPLRRHGFQGGRNRAHGKTEGRP